MTDYITPNQAEIDTLAEAFPLDDKVVLETLQDAVRGAYLEAQSIQNGGAMVSLDEEAIAIWNAAVEKAFNTWLKNR